MSSIVNGFTQVQKEEYKKYFDQFDQGQKNYLTNDEMNNLLEYLGLSTYRELFNNFDMITYNNYLSILQKKIERQKLEEEIIKAFEFFDKDKKGYFEIDFFKSFKIFTHDSSIIYSIDDKFENYVQLIDHILLKYLFDKSEIIKIEDAIQGMTTGLTAKEKCRMIDK